MLNQFTGIVGQYLPVMSNFLGPLEIEVILPGPVDYRRQRHFLLVIFFNPILDIAVVVAMQWNILFLDQLLFNR
jgi:hypothetical protein